MQNVFERVLRQAEQRRAEHERHLAETRQLEWQRALVMRLLVRRFGAVSEDVARQVQMATREQLERYADRLVVASSLADVISGE